MGWWQVSADTLARGRFVISPLAETTASLLMLERGVAAHPGERRWLDAHQAAYRGYVKDHPDVPSLIRVSLARCWIPAVITSAPASDDELAEFIQGVVQKKEERHHIGEPDFVPASRTMVHIGG